MKKDAFIGILLILVLGVGLGIALMIRIFITEKNSNPDTYWRDEHYEEIIVGKEPENDRMNNISVNLRSPIRKVYVSSNSNYIPTWTRENLKNAGKKR